MKRFIPFLLALTAVFAVVFSGYSSPVASEEPTNTLYIKVIRHPNGGHTNTTRSGADPVVAWYDADLSLLEVCFNEEVGRVSVSVTDSKGQELARYACETYVDPVAYLYFTAEEGEVYTINLVGKDFEGVGYMAY